MESRPYLRGDFPDDAIATVSTPAEDAMEPQTTPTSTSPSSRDVVRRVMILPRHRQGEPPEIKAPIAPQPVLKLASSRPIVPGATLVINGKTYRVRTASAPQPLMVKKEAPQLDVNANLPPLPQPPGPLRPPPKRRKTESAREFERIRIEQNICSVCGMDFVGQRRNFIHHEAECRPMEKVCAVEHEHNFVSLPFPTYEQGFKFYYDAGLDGEFKSVIAEIAGGYRCRVESSEDSNRNRFFRCF